MRPFRIKEIATIYLPLFLLLACTTTVTKFKNPVFSWPIDSLQTSLSRLIVCKHIHLEGKEVTTRGKSSAQLEIDILNGKDIPNDDDRMITLAHTLASTVKDALKNKNEYDNYTVLFVKVDSSALTTKRTWKGKTFNSAEL